MEQFDMLWEYQQEDMKAERIANEIRRSPTRIKLEKDRDYIIEHQKQYKAIEEQLALMADRMDVIRDALPRCEEQLASLTERMENNAPADLEAVRSLINELRAVRDTINGFEAEMRKIYKESSDQSSRQKSLRHEAANVKLEFDALKASYDKELSEQKVRLDEQKKLAEEKKQGIEPRLLEEYMTIRKHITPPVARLISGQCGGCNTSMPSAQLRKIKAGELVECETCGRMLIP